ncbi:hypothetical protein ADUPG1_012774 [Aduncisulcus paluster]|uniref:Uncharacterized protein n=1 Tax=Aduncisulcus paluster TaxID=2918883 RepID=A0ABQ5K0M4_9EUKA|nr:hypothetical protein ADUPG1_012774 [Aduncisulcus paluster]
MNGEETEQELLKLKSLLAEISLLASDSSYEDGVALLTEKCKQFKSMLLHVRQNMIDRTDTLHLTLPSNIERYTLHLMSEVDTMRMEGSKADLESISDLLK